MIRIREASLPIMPNCVPPRIFLAATCKGCCLPTCHNRFAATAKLMSLMFVSVAFADNEAGLLVKMGKSQSSRTTDAMLTALCCCWRGLLSGPSGGDTILYPRVARGRPVSTTGHRQPISVVAAAPQPPHTAHVISVIIL